MEELVNKINELNERIDYLEKREQKRKRKETTRLVFNLLKAVVIIAALVYGYIYVNNNFIKPYKEKVDYIEEKIDKVQNINPFNKNN